MVGEDGEGRQLVQVLVRKDTGPADTHEWIEHGSRHHVDEPFVKRKRKRHGGGDAGFGRRAPLDAGGRGGGRHD